MTRAKRHAAEKPLHWVGSSKRDLLELPEDDAAGTYRAVYSVRFEKAVYVLHVFQKKSPSGVKTARSDIRLVETRLKTAREDYEERYG